MFSGMVICDGFVVSMKTIHHCNNWCVVQQPASLRLLDAQDTG